MSPRSARSFCSSKTWLTRPLSRMRHDVAALGHGDARRLLPAVLQRVEGEVGEAGDIRAGGVDAEDAALVARSVAELEHEGRRIAARPARTARMDVRSALTFPRASAEDRHASPPPPPGGTRCHASYGCSWPFAGRARHRQRRRPASAGIWTEIPSGTTAEITAIEYQSATRFWFTTSTGEIWKREADLSGFENVRPPVHPLNDIEFQTGGDVGFAVGADGTVLRSANGGATWAVVPSAGIPVSNVGDGPATSAPSTRRWATSTSCASPATAGSGSAPTSGSSPRRRPTPRRRWAPPARGWTRTGSRPSRATTATSRRATASSTCSSPRTSTRSTSRSASAMRRSSRPTT